MTDRSGAALLRGSCALLFAALLVSCGGGGGSSPFVPPGGGGGGGGGGGPPVTVSGSITFDRVPFSATARQGLDFAGVVQAPVRGATVEAVQSAGQVVLATTTTDANGAYSLSVAGSTDVFIRVRAEMVKTGSPAWNFSVRDNTNGEALYTLDGAVSTTGTAASTRNLNAPSGFTVGTGYTGTRAAAPFSILDAVYQAFQLVLSAAPTASFPELRMQWSTRNVDCGPIVGQPTFCDNSSAAFGRGEIGTTFFFPGTPSRIYVLGNADSDTDEFDQHVIAHEWGHYYQDRFSRDDSVGGEHSLNDRLDLRVAFSEGWGNAFAGMAKRDPVYRDSFGTRQQQGFEIDVESNSAPFPGWYSESSLQSIFYDVFDSANDGPDTVSLGFAPIHAVMTNEIRNTRAFTSVYPLILALQANQAGSAAAIGTLATTQLIATGGDDFGSNEINNGQDARNLPIYPLITAGAAPRQICSTAPAAIQGPYNKLGNRRYARFDLLAAGRATVTATLVTGGGAAISDPDIVLFGNGVELGRAEGTVNGSETLSNLSLPVGTYVIEVYEFSNIGGSSSRGDTCFNVQLAVS